MINNQLLKSILNNILVILLFISFELPIILATSPSIFKVVVFYLFNIAFFYFNRYVFWPFVLKNTRRLWWLMLAPCLLFGYFIATMLITYFSNLIVDIPFDLARLQFRMTFYRGAQIMGIGLLFYYQYLSILKERQARLLEQAYHRALLNPHLLFNTLNFVYDEIRDAQPKQAAALLILSDIMRYALRQSKVTHKATINEEMEQMKRYIQLHQMLSEEGFYIDFVTNMKDHLGQVEIPSLLLVNLVENMFKHGNFKNPDDPALIDLTADDKLIRFRFVNTKRYKSAFRGEHFGIDNTRQRLLQTYGKRFKLDIENNDTHYILNLIIHL